MVEEALKEIGLSEKEIKIYLALLNLGPSLASKISEKTQIPRTFTYDLLKDLKDKGIISFFIRENRRYFKAINPDELLVILKEKHKLQEQLIQDSIEKLKENQFKENPEKPLVEIYEGEKGIKTLLNKILMDKPKEVISYGGSGLSRKIFPLFIKHWHKRRQESKIKFKVLYNNTDEAKTRFKTYKEDLKLSKVKFGDITLLSAVNTVLYENTTILLYSSKYPFGILIKNGEVYTTNLKTFEHLWGLAKIQ
ncbi:MAG: helix-turn-helix domain-containing protein [Candidatus Nanoarchaeia archaeon]|nr:helix-turn-helix domain-containing protein [Candidatus Nanoarchaeia archaeon]